MPRPRKKIVAHDAICRRLLAITKCMHRSDAGERTKESWQLPLRELTTVLCQVPLDPDQRANVIRRLRRMDTFTRMDHGTIWIHICHDRLADEQQAARTR